MTLNELKKLRESEDKVEFKEARHNFSFAGSSHTAQEGRRKCFLGYVVAFANEGGGMLIFGMADKRPHKVVGSDFGERKIGELEDETYSRLGLRVKMEELFENDKRVLVVHIPGRPIGKMLKFEGVPLMRVGESLRNMSDEEMYAILSEQEPDFSAKICEDLDISDIDENAINILKEAYSRKQENPQFLTLSNKQVLSDLGLLDDSGITYAALILIGKKEAIKKHLPQATTNLEYRNTLTQINFDNRHIFSEPYYLAIEKLWELIDQRNGKVPVQQGPYIFDIPFFNKEVIREAINNSIAHRDYRKASEVVIKQFSNAMHIINPGGFPLGVTLDNLLTVNSTPRNRLLADVMAKTGVVERAGQGIDKIFYQTISEAKPEPDYTKSDNYQVELRLSSVVEDKAFSLFIKSIQQERELDDKLSVHEVITLNSIRKGIDKKLLNNQIIKKLEKENLIERIGKTKSQRLILSKIYFEFTDKRGEYLREKSIDNNQITLLVIQHLQEFEKAKMGDFVTLLNKLMTREQVKYFIAQLVEKQILETEGKQRGTIYRKGKKIEKNEKLVERALHLGLEEMKKRGELNNE